MDEEFDIVYVARPEDAAWGIIGGGLHEFNRAQAGNENGQRICFALRGPGQEILGGVLGAIYWDWFYIDLMWIPEQLRGRGYGHRLLALAEEEARKQGARHVFLDTFSFQAPDFYRRHGYQVFGELQDFPPGHQRYFLTKQL